MLHEAFRALLNFLPVCLALLPLGLLAQQKPRSACHLGGILLFAYVLTAVFTVTGIPSLDTVQWDMWRQGFSWELFAGSTFQMVANCLLFVPLGLLLPWVWPSCRAFWKTALWGFGLSLLIEMSQLFSFRTPDVDDLLMNTAGAVLGYLIFLLFAKGFPRLAQAGCRMRRGALPLSITAVYLIMFLGSPWI